MDNPWNMIPNIEGVVVESKMIEMYDDWLVRVMFFKPEKIENSTPLVLVPGWNSIYEGWRQIVEAWAKKREVIYIETREKASAISKGKLTRSNLSITQTVSDLDAIKEKCPTIGSGCDWFASSLGATSVLEALKSGVFTANSVSLLAPNVSFRFPLWSRPLIIMPSLLYPPLVRFAIFYLDLKLKEEGQKIRYRRTLLASDVRRLRLSALSNGSYQMDLDFDSVDTRIALITAESDALHADTAVSLLMERLENGSIINVPSNQFAHNPEVIPILEAFQKGDKPS